MAVDGGDIRFTFTGDSSGLNSELKKIDKNLGEVSKATAGASNGMEKGLVKGAKAADKAADKMAASIGKAKAEMDQASVSAQKMGDKMEMAGDSAGSVDSSLTGVGAALGQVNPQMGELAGTAGDAAGAIDGMVLAAMAGPVAFTAIATTVVFAGAAFSQAARAAEDFEAAMEKESRQQDKNIKALKRHEAVLEEIDTAHHDATKGVDGFTRGLLDQLEELQAAEKLMERRIKTQINSGKISESQGKKEIESLRARTKAAEDQLVEMAKNERSIKAAREESMQATRDARRAEMALAEAARNRAAEEAKIARERAAQAALQNEFLTFEEKAETIRRNALEFRTDEVALIQQNAALRMTAIQAEFDALDEQLQKEPRLRQALADAVTAIHDQMNHDIDMANEALSIKERERRKRENKILEDDEKKSLEDRLKARDDAFTASLEVTSGLLTVTRELEAEFANASIEERQRLFNIQKGASIADATINGAVAITRALADLGPIAGAVAAAAITATTAAQISLIAQQEPAFDTGGIVRGGLMANSGDQMSARVLPGEAILNRSATDRIGEQGINALNGGAGLGGVTVVPAYRHFDRFIRDEYRKGGSFRRIVTREREFPVGQRRY